MIAWHISMSCRSVEKMKWLKGDSSSNLRLSEPIFVNNEHFCLNCNIIIKMEKLRPYISLAKSKMPDFGKLRSKLPETPEQLKKLNKQFQLFKQKYFGVQPVADKSVDSNFLTTLSLLIVSLSLLTLLLERDYFSLIPKK